MIDFSFSNFFTCSELIKRGNVIEEGESSIIKNQKKISNRGNKTYCFFKEREGEKKERRNNGLETRGEEKYANPNPNHKPNPKDQEKGQKTC